jgi:hypothetical protein
MLKPFAVPTNAPAVGLTARRRRLHLRHRARELAGGALWVVALLLLALLALVGFAGFLTS